MRGSAARPDDGGVVDAGTAAYVKNVGVDSGVQSAMPRGCVVEAGARCGDQAVAAPDFVRSARKEYSEATLFCTLVYSGAPASDSSTLVIRFSACVRTPKRHFVYSS